MLAFNAENWSFISVEITSSQLTGMKIWVTNGVMANDVIIHCSKTMYLGLGIGLGKGSGFISGFIS